MTDVIVRMWEAKIQNGEIGASVQWVVNHLVPSARQAGASSVEVCYAPDPDPRVVVITRWTTETQWREPTIETGIILRSHAWSFRSLTLDEVGNDEVGNSD